MSSLRNAFAASLIALSTAACATQPDNGPWLIGGGDNAQIVYRTPSSNVVGGAFASLVGGGDNLQIAYGPQVVTQASNGLIAELIGGGDNAQVVYHQVAPAGSMLAAGATQRRG